MGFIGIVSFNIHDDQLFVVISSKNDASSCPSACLSFQDFEVCTEQMIKQSTFSCILGSNDSNSKIILVAIS